MDRQPQQHSDTDIIVMVVVVWVIGGHRGGWARAASA